MTLCLFGGAFNPPHRTHERVIRAALAQLPITRLLVLPCGAHPLKLVEELAPPSVRVELCRLAFGALNRVAVDDWETRQAGPSYTVQTVRHFAEYAGASRRPYWIIGSDNLKMLPTWHRHHELLQQAVLVTCPRMGHLVDETELQGLDLTERERTELLAHVLRLEPDATSASAIRRALREGRDVRAWLHPPVERRIRALRLYGAGPEPPAAARG